MITAELVVAVLTYRRPEGLASILPRLVEQAIQAEQQLGITTTVLAVDNDPYQSARDVVERQNGVRYVHEPTPGIPAARNRALAEADAAEFIVFIDDDEVPEPDWLVHLIETQRRTGAEAVVGAVVPLYEIDADPWIVAGGFFVRDRWPTGTHVVAAATNNLLLTLGPLRDWRIRFDERFATSGGSDTVLTRAIVARGGRIVWCDEAVVKDHIPASRLNRRWVLRRAFRSGNSDVRASLHLAPSPLQRAATRAKAVGRGGVRVLFGASRAVVGYAVRSESAHARGLRTMNRGLGMIAGSLGRTFEEYRRPDSI